MMDAQRFITRLAESGVSLSTDGQALDVACQHPLTDRQWDWLESHKSELIALLAANDERHRLWLITRPDGTRFSLSRNPPGTLAEIQADYPGCTVALEDPES